MSKQYLAYIREINKAKASKCHICKKQSTGINAYKHEIKFVCDEHFRREAEVILDTSIPGVLHYIYPNGKKVPEHMMNPNIGGFIPRDNKPKKSEKEIQDEIWATQIFFEE